ncbi:MAG: RNA polymerase factor sigma-54 [Stomatobaculum sp.]|nr:RNA polymerase factor sigma-54 [Stomatobaculum sp.]
MKLGMHLEQKQTISQQMIQTLKVLEMNVTELEVYLSRLSAENPVVELEPSEFRKESEDIALSRQAEFARKLEWLSSADRQNRTYYADDAPDQGLDGVQDPSSSGETLPEYLHAQLLLKDCTKQDFRILDFMARSLDSRGYFTEPLTIVTDRYRISDEKAETLLRKLQDLEPAGVGARNLKECLLLQLRRRAGDLVFRFGNPGTSSEKTAEEFLESAELTELAEQLILFHLEDIARNHIDIIARKRSVTRGEIEAACRLIRRLNPKPGNAFSDGRVLPYVRPDVIVIREEEDDAGARGSVSESASFQVLVNDYQYPRLSVNSFYEALAKETDDPEAKKYLQEKLSQIAQVKTDLANRSSTLSRVAGLLVRLQEAFFLRGPGHRSPMVLSDLAEPLSLHESTVSRTLKDKYLQCSWGVFPMNYFLNAAAGKISTGISSGPGVSSEPGTDEVHRALREIIDAEDKAKPLSDEKLCAALAERGIQIARRTVNKYRKEMGIPDKSGRKKLPD